MNHPNQVSSRQDSAITLLVGHPALHSKNFTHQLKDHHFFRECRVG